jgi:hypothetical protein
VPAIVATLAQGLPASLATVTVEEQSMASKKKADPTVGEHDGPDVGRGLTGGQPNPRGRVGGGRRGRSER